MIWIYLVSMLVSFLVCYYMLKSFHEEGKDISYIDLLIALLLSLTPVFNTVWLIIGGVLSLPWGKLESPIIKGKRDE